MREKSYFVFNEQIVIFIEQIVQFYHCLTLTAHGSFQTDTTLSFGSEISEAGSSAPDGQAPGLLNTMSNMTSNVTSNMSMSNVTNVASNVTNVASNVTNITKQRIKLNVKVLGVQLGPGGSPGGADGLPGSGGQAGAKTERQSYREHFVSPEMSLVSKFMSKVRTFWHFRPILDGRINYVTISRNLCAPILLLDGSADFFN
jgi:hypothetical protein